ncbi:MAG: LemA family protein [Synergistaceae bacterium]|nr:LemA family protein [Synergistaceae bacterium]
MGWVEISGIVVLGALILWFMYVYNTFANKQHRIDEWWDEVDTHLRLRHDIIPLLLEKARLMIAEEGPTLDRIAEFNEKTAADSDNDDLEYLENGLSIALHNLKDSIRSHSSAMLDIEFLTLMGELVSIEGRASSACREHNLLVNEFNTSIRKFPSNLVVKFLHFCPKEMRIFVGPDGNRP